MLSAPTTAVPLGLLPRLMKFAPLTPEQLEIGHVVEIANIFGLEVSPENVHMNEIVAALRRSDIDSMFDVLGKPEVLSFIMTGLVGPARSTLTCPVCELEFSVPVGVSDAAECPCCSYPVPSTSPVPEGYSKGVSHHG